MLAISALAKIRSLSWVGFSMPRKEVHRLVAGIGLGGQFCVLPGGEGVGVLVEMLILGKLIMLTFCKSKMKLNLYVHSCPKQLGRCIPRITLFSPLGLARQ